MPETHDIYFPRSLVHHDPQISSENFLSCCQHLLQNNIFPITVTLFLLIKPPPNETLQSTILPSPKRRSHVEQLPFLLVLSAGLLAFLLLFDAKQGLPRSLRGKLAHVPPMDRLDPVLDHRTGAACSQTRKDLGRQDLFLRESISADTLGFGDDSWGTIGMFIMVLLGRKKSVRQNGSK